MKNRFDIQTLRKMQELMNSPSLDERGFTLCVNQRDLKIRHGRECQGDSCTVSLGSSVCNENENPLGNFHTHPKRVDTTPSIPDLALAAKDGMGCIGANKSRRVTCFTPRHDLNVNPSDAMNVIFDDLLNAKEGAFRNKFTYKNLSEEDFDEGLTRDPNWRNEYQKAWKRSFGLFDRHEIF